MSLSATPAVYKETEMWSSGYLKVLGVKVKRNSSTASPKGHCSSRPAEAELHQTPATLLHGKLAYMSVNVDYFLMETMQVIDCPGCLLGDPRMSPQLWCTFIFFLCFCSEETVVAKPRPARHVSTINHKFKFWIFGSYFNVIICFP